MSVILNLKEYDVVITHRWSNHHHGICGHTFEVIEYFWTLKDAFNCCILLAERITKEEFVIAIESKYDFTTLEIEYILSRTIFNYLPKLVMAKNMLFTDGSFNTITNLTLIYDNLFLFSCGDKTIKENTNENIFVLQDHRIYDKAKVNSIEYIKKILFSRFKDITKHQNKTLIYATKNCRILSDNYYSKLLSDYTDDFLVLTNEENKLTFTNDRITQIKMPVQDIFEQFNKYIYTPINRQFDCSPRFIAECKYYGLEVIYDVDYNDKGLEARREDLNDLDKITLTKDDDIINIIKSVINT
jgi:hypothetical protein